MLQQIYFFKQRKVSTKRQLILTSLRARSHKVPKPDSLFEISSLNHNKITELKPIQFIFLQSLNYLFEA